MYRVQTKSELGKQIANAKLGIVFHTTYTGGTIADLSASFGADISKLGASKDVWVDDASYKDVSGNATLTATETLKLSNYLTAVGKQFHNIKKKDLDKFNDIQKTIESERCRCNLQNILQCTNTSR